MVGIMLKKKKKMFARRNDDGFHAIYWEKDGKTNPRIQLLCTDSQVEWYEATSFSESIGKEIGAATTLRLIQK